MTERRQSSGNGEEETPCGAGLRPSPTFWWWPAPSPTRRKSGKIEDIGALDSARRGNPSFGRTWDELVQWGATRIAYQYELEARLGGWGGAGAQAYPFGRPFSMLKDKEYSILMRSVSGSDWLNEDPRRSIKVLPAVRMGNELLPEHLIDGNVYESGWVSFCGWKLWSSDRMRGGERGVEFSVNLAMSDRAIMAGLVQHREALGIPEGGFEQLIREAAQLRRERGIQPLRSRTNVAGSARDRGPEFSWSAVQALDEVSAAQKCRRTYEARKKILQRAKRDWWAWHGVMGSSWYDALKLGRRLLVGVQT